MPEMPYIEKIKSDGFDPSITHYYQVRDSHDAIVCNCKSFREAYIAAREVDRAERKG